MLAPQFSNLPGTVFMMLLEYTVIVLLSNYCQKCYTSNHQSVLSNASIDENDSPGVNTTPKDIGSHKNQVHQLMFERTYESYTPLLTNIMFCTRFLSLGYVLGISVVAEELLTKSDGIFFFTNWNTKLISLYFLLSTICSLIGLVEQQQPSCDRRGIRRSLKSLFLCTVHCLFEICGGTAILVTVVAFGLLDPSFTFWNVSCHFVTLVTLLVEMTLNTMFVRLNHIALNVTWAFIYISFVWIVVYTGRHHWPYYFLETSSSICYIQYSGLVIADLFFYFVWWSLSQVKCFVLKGFLEDSCTTAVENEGNSTGNRRGITNGSPYSPVPLNDRSAAGQERQGIRGPEPFIL